MKELSQIVEAIKKFAFENTFITEIKKPKNYYPVEKIVMNRRMTFKLFFC